MISSQRGLTAYTRTRSLALSAAARNRPPYCIRGVAPTIAMERGFSILWIDAICGSVQNSMTPPPKERGASGRQAYALRTGLPSADIPASLAEAERLGQSLLGMRLAIDAPDPRATNPDPVLLTAVKRARRCFDAPWDALVSGRIGSVAELASLEGISDRYEAVALVVIQTTLGSNAWRI